MMRNKKAQGPAYHTIGIILALVMGIALVGGVMVFWGTVQGGLPGSQVHALQNAPSVCPIKGTGPVWYTLVSTEERLKIRDAIFGGGTWRRETDLVPEYNVLKGTEGGLLLGNMITSEFITYQGTEYRQDYTYVNFLCTDEVRVWNDPEVDRKGQWEAPPIVFNRAAVMHREFCGTGDERKQALADFSGVWGPYDAGDKYFIKIGMKSGQACIDEGKVSDCENVDIKIIPGNVIDYRDHSGGQAYGGDYFYPPHEDIDYYSNEVDVISNKTLLAKFPEIYSYDEPVGDSYNMSKWIDVLDYGIGEDREFYLFVDHASEECVIQSFFVEHME